MMSCTKFCGDSTKREFEVEWNQRGIWKRTYRLAMFALKSNSKFEDVVMFTNLNEYYFKRDILVSAKSPVEWGKCGDSIFLVHHDSDNDIPMKRFCELYYHSGGQVSNEEVKSLPRFG